MVANKSPEGSPHLHISELLFSDVSALAALHDEARDRLVNDGDLEGHKAKLVEQTELIAGLSDEIAIFKDGGGTVPQKVDDFAAMHSAEAKQALEEGSDYSGIAFSLHVKRGDPSTLEQLAERVSPPDVTT